MRDLLGTLHLGSSRAPAWRPSASPGKSPPMTIQADFDSAQVRVKGLRSTPGPSVLLELYALFKQGTLGDVTGHRPGMFDMKGRAKFDAWEKKKGLPKEGAQASYVRLVAELERQDR